MTPVFASAHSALSPPARGVFSADSLSANVDAAVARTRDWLLAHQHADGYWCGELEGDTILESEYILLLAWLGEEHSEAAQKAARYILEKQSPCGGWALFPGGDADISVSVKAYFALKLTGHNPNSLYMRRARDVIFGHGGADRVNSFTRFYLALLGQISYDHCPAVPPELVLLPRRSPVNIYRMSAWTRTILVPLSIMWAHRPVRELTPEQGIGELFVASPELWPALRSPGLAPQRGWLSWDRFFRAVDASLKWCERQGARPLRKLALKEAERWMTLRFGGSDGLGAIFPPIIWSLVALKCLGYDDRSAEVAYCREQLEALMIEEKRATDDGADRSTIRLQPCKSPVWDTALSLRALSAAGVAAADEAMERAVDWLLDKEVTRRGDWAQYVDAEPGGWYFEHHNEFYPDVDDTIMAMMALRPLARPLEAVNAVDHQLQGPHWGGVDATGGEAAASAALDEQAARQRARRFERTAEACERAQRWILAMQNRDGGWGAFDRDNDSEFLCRVPFADHNAMIDPSTPDITARVVEALADWGVSPHHPAMMRAVQYLRRTQEPDGAWFGRWGVNYIYGVWQVLVGLAAAGAAPDDESVSRGADWLLAHQQLCGGWGESPRSYAEAAHRGRGAPTPSQTAWALLGLIAAGRADHPAVARGVQWLLERQRDNGAWEEPEFTGTGFPQVFYLRYHYYPIYFPLLALSKWKEHNSKNLKINIVNQE